MSEGIFVTCKKGALQWMITEKPYALVNDAETKQLSWKEPALIPLVPNMPYKITVAFPYVGKKACMPATIQVTVKEGEVQKFLYKTASTMFSAGKLDRV
jgi:hypothetical protein